MTGQIRLRLSRLGDRHTRRIAMWTAGLAVAAAWLPAALLDPRLRQYLHPPDTAILNALLGAVLLGLLAACVVNRGAAVAAFAAGSRWRAIVVGGVLAAYAVTMTACELAGVGAAAETAVTAVLLLGSAVLLAPPLIGKPIIELRESTLWLTLGAVYGTTILIGIMPAFRRRHHVPTSTAWSFVGQSAFALAVGATAAWLVARWMRGLPRRWRWLRVPAAAAMAAYPLFLLLVGELLGGVDEVALLPILMTLAVLGRRAMARSSRVLVKQAADLFGALGFGVVTVLTLVWLADVLDLPGTEIDALKSTAAHLREVIDLPWWLWVLVYVALAGAQLVLAFGPGWAARVRAWVRRGTATARLADRTMSTTSIVLLFIAFVAATAPAAVAPVLAHRIRAHYTVSVSAQVEAEQEQAIAQAVIRSFNQPNRPDLAVLRTMFADIHAIDHPHRPGTGPTGTEAGLAVQLGQLHGQIRADIASNTGVSDHGDAPQPPDATAAGLASRLVDPTDLSHRLTTVRAQDKRAEQRQEAADAAMDLAASAISVALTSIPLPFGMDSSEVIGLVREYLRGLAESSIGTMFRSWAQRAARDGDAGAGPAPDAAALVEPNARQVEIEARLQYLRIKLDAKAGTSTEADQRVDQEERQDPMLAAVDLANQIRYLRTGSGVCAACVHPGGLYEHTYENRPDVRIEPHEPIR
jgi:hypothetical protein